MEGCGGEWFGVPVPRLFLFVGALHPIRRQCTRSDRVQRPVRGAVPGVEVAARTMVELVTPKRCAIEGSSALDGGAVHWIVASAMPC